MYFEFQFLVKFDLISNFQISNTLSFVSLSMINIGEGLSSCCVPEGNWGCIRVKLGAASILVVDSSFGLWSMVSLIHLICFALYSSSRCT